MLKPLLLRPRTAGRLLGLHVLTIYHHVPMLRICDTCVRCPGWSLEERLSRLEKRKPTPARPAVQNPELLAIFQEFDMLLPAALPAAAPGARPYSLEHELQPLLTAKDLQQLLSISRSQAYRLLNGIYPGTHVLDVSSSRPRSVTTKSLLEYLSRCPAS